MLRQAADYHDFVNWEKELLESEAGKAHLLTEEQLEEARLPVLELRRIADHQFKLTRGQAYQRF